MQILKMEVKDMPKKKNKEKRDTIHGGDLYSIRQNAHYGPGGKAEPDNNIFWEEKQSVK